MMATKEIKNVLVLGTESVKTSQFCKSFQEYLIDDSYFDAKLGQWQWQCEEISRPTILIDNLKLIIAPDLEGSFISNQIISTSSKLEKEQRLNAIIILLKQDPKDKIHLMKLKGFLSNVLKQHPENILYLYEFNFQNEETIKKQLNTLGGCENMFYLNGNTFYNKTSKNWSEGVNVCSAIYNYIDGGNKNGLKSIYIQNYISNKLLTTLIDNLLELLIQIYILNNIQHFILVNGTYQQHSVYISEYKRNVTVCYGNNCIKTVTYYDHNLDENIDVKIPKICHAPCNCMKTNTKCKLFETSNSTCMHCKCNAGFHSQNDFKTKCEEYYDAKEESQIAISTLAMFYIFKKQEQEKIDFKEIFGRFLNLDQSNANTIFNTFNNDFNKKVRAFEKYSLKPINIVNSTLDLYNMKKTGKIIPKVIEELFPNDIQLQLKLKNLPSNESNIKTSEIDNAKIKIQTLTNEVVELKRTMGNILNSDKDYKMEDKVNDLNSRVKTSAYGRTNLKPNKKDNECNMVPNGIKNVLVLSTDGANSRQFCKLFEAYLLYDSYDNALIWQPKLKEDDEINRPTIFVNDLKLICIPDLEDSFFSKQIISVLSNFQEQQSLNAIIILSKQNGEDNVHFIKLQSFLSHVLQKFPGNVLYINELNMDSYQCQQTIKEQFEILGVKDNIFYLNETIFYDVTKNNWSAGVNFCNTINNYIDGDGDKEGLETIYIRNGISKEIVLCLINNLLELLILIYVLTWTRTIILIGDKFEECYLSIEKCNRNVTVCYGNRCAIGVTLQNCYKDMFTYLLRRRPKLCHILCNCVNANRDGTKCIIFETPTKTCMQCDCEVEFHSQFYFDICSDIDYDYNDNLEDESKIALEVLVKFYLFKEQNQEMLDFKNLFNRFSYLDGPHCYIFEGFQNDFNEKVKLYKDGLVNSIDILTSIQKLYDIKKSATIIPEFIEELFPKDIRLETITHELETKLQNNEDCGKLLCETSEIDEAKMKIQMLIDELTGLKHMFDNNKDDVAEGSVNDLNIPLKEDETPETLNINLSPNEKDFEEKDIN